MAGTAAAMLSRKGMKYAKAYLDVDPEGKECLASCEYGHEGCAHYRHGPCMGELYLLIHKKARES